MSEGSQEGNGDLECKLASFKYVKKETSRGDSRKKTIDVAENVPEAAMPRRSKRQRIDLKLDDPVLMIDGEEAVDENPIINEVITSPVVPQTQSVPVNPEHIKRLSRTCAVIPEEMPASYLPTSGYRKKITPPDHWKQHHENIYTMRSQSIAPVDTMGCERCIDDDASEIIRRWQVLVGLVLSSQTRDEVNYAAVQRLIALNGCTVHAIAAMDESELEQLLKPVSFYRIKAKNLIQIANTCVTKYNGDIPKSVAEIVGFPGVGPKMAYLCMSAAWNVCAGIGVDVHVHRIANRLNWVKTSTPIQTQLELQAWLPHEYWPNLNILLVGFGQTICLPQRPKCSECLNRNICPASSAKDKRVKS